MKLWLPLEKIINIYTDGACSNNGYANASGGWGFIIDHPSFSYAGAATQIKGTTNQRMELTAAIEALEYFDSLGTNESVSIITDSAYLCNCVNNKWYINWERNGWKNAKKEAVANQDLWEKLIKWFKKTNVFFVKVKGHSGNKFNEIVDGLATGRIKPNEVYQ